MMERIVLLIRLLYGLQGSRNDFSNLSSVPSES